MINQALRLIRTFYDVPQSELSARFCISKSYLSEIESGKKQPTMDILNKYSEEFDIPLSSILFFSENLDSNKMGDKFRLGIAKKVVSILEWNQSRNDAAIKFKEKTKTF